MSREVRSVIAVWLVLMASTAASAWGFSRPAVVPVISTIAVMAIAALKVRLVMTHFMEMRNAPLVWQLVGVVWLIGAAGTVMAIYLL